MTKTDYVWLMIIGVIGAVGTAPGSSNFGRGTLEFLAWLGLALFGLLGLVGALPVA